MTLYHDTMEEIEKRVVYINPYYDVHVPSGGNRRMDELVQRFARDFGENFTLIIAKGKGNPDWKVVNLIEVDYHFDHWSKIGAMLQIGKILNALPPSMVIIESIPIPYHALKRHAHFQVAYDFRYFTGDSKSLLYRLTFSSYLKYQWRKASHMVTSSEFSIDELKKYVGYSPDRVIKSFFGIDERVLDIALTPLPEKAYDIIYVGHFEKRKNHESLLRAIALIDKELRVMLIGRDNGLKTAIETLAQTLGLKHVTFGDRVDDTTLWQLYRKSRVFAYPSIYEGFGIPTIEALALGVPAVIADIPVFREVGGNLVTYFDPLNPIDISEKIKARLLDGQVPAPELVRTHLEQFFWENIYTKFVKDISSASMKPTRD